MALVAYCKFIHDLMKSWFIVCDLLILKTILDYVLAARILRAIAIIGIVIAFGLSSIPIRQ
jgi:hypothetical protein